MPQPGCERRHASHQNGDRQAARTSCFGNWESVRRATYVCRAPTVKSGSLSAGCLRQSWQRRRADGPEARSSTAKPAGFDGPPPPAALHGTGSRRANRCRLSGRRSTATRQVHAGHIANGRPDIDRRPASSCRRSGHHSHRAEVAEVSAGPTGTSDTPGPPDRLSHPPHAPPAHNGVSRIPLA